MQSAFPPIEAHVKLDVPKGFSLLTTPLLNKGTAYTESEIDALSLRGLVPPRYFSIEDQEKRALGNFRRCESDLQKYIYLSSLQHRNETLFFRILQDNLEEMMPIIYTPTVGQACLEYGSIFRRPRGLWITNKDRGRIADILRHWPNKGVRLIVVTDGERILGLGDLGALGMGISVGKLCLYTACAGVHPYYTLPITIDAGTDNEKLLQDPMYIGHNEKRVRGPEYEHLMDEFVWSVQRVFPGCLLQFEDFGSHNAFTLLEEYRGKVSCFNDDIQGTAAVVLAGVISALRITGTKLRDQRLLFLGAGESATGIGELFVNALKSEGVAEAEARKACWFFDSKGLVTKSRGNLPKHKQAFAHDVEFTSDFLEAIEKFRPTALIGASGTPKTFTQPIVEAMTQIDPHPIIFALSNPTSRAECTAEEAYHWSNGRAIFASGSPFPPVAYNGKTFAPGQGNNVYIFPGVGLGVLVSQARQVTDSMFLQAARTLADMAEPSDLEQGRLYPSFKRIREVSARIAAAVCKIAHDEGLAQAPYPADILADVKSRMYEPIYRPYV